MLQALHNTTLFRASLPEWNATTTRLNHYLTKMDWDKINNLTSSIHQMVAHHSSKPEQVDPVVHRALDGFFGSFVAPHKAYQPVISQLIGYRCFHAASTVYDRMLKKGLTPSMDVDAQMLAVAVSLSPDNVTLLNALDNLFTNPSFTEDSLLRALRVMLDLGTSPTVVLDVTQKFIEAKSDDYTPGKLLLAKLVDLQVRNDKLEDALESLGRFDQNALGDRSHLPPQLPYVTIMSAIRDTKAWDNNAVNRVLQTMQENGVKPNVALFNVLISGEARERNLDQAFSIYTMLKALKAKNRNVVPDAFTFCTLFNALRLRETSSTILPTRYLFSDMMEIYQSDKLDINPSIVINTHVLNIALRAFLLERDYPAAFIVIRSFGRLKQQVDKKTYYIVMKHVMNRIRRDIKRVRMSGESRWGDRFLGVPPHRYIYQMPVDEQLANKVLAYGRQPLFDVSKSVVEVELKDDSAMPTPEDEKDNSQDMPTSALLFEQKRRIHLTPTLEMMDGDEPAPENVPFSLIPLKRVLKRAVLAELMDPAKGTVFRAGTGRRYFERRVLREIQQAEREMGLAGHRSDTRLP